MKLTSVNNQLEDVHSKSDDDCELWSRLWSRRFGEESVWTQQQTMEAGDEQQARL